MYDLCLLEFGLTLLYVYVLEEKIVGEFEEKNSSSLILLQRRKLISHSVYIIINCCKLSNGEDKLY